MRALRDWLQRGRGPVHVRSPKGWTELPLYDDEEGRIVGAAHLAVDLGGHLTPDELLDPLADELVDMAEEAWEAGAFWAAVWVPRKRGEIAAWAFAVQLQFETSRPSIDEMLTRLHSTSDDDELPPIDSVVDLPAGRAVRLQSMLAPSDGAAEPALVEVSHTLVPAGVEFAVQLFVFPTPAGAGDNVAAAADELARSVDVRRP